jgi:hypothetical protein
MSLWTPSGEHRVGEERKGDAPTAGPGPGAGAPGSGSGGQGPGPGGQGPGSGSGGPGSGAAGTASPTTATTEQLADDDVAALRQQLAEAPAEVVVANHCYGLFELAAVYLSSSPPSLEHARLAIDALGFLVDGLGERLGEAHAPLRDALAQLRLAYVQIAGSL